MARKQEFDQRICPLKKLPFSVGMFYENYIAKLKIDNIVCEKLQLKLTSLKFLKEIVTQFTSDEHDFSIHCTIFPAQIHQEKLDLFLLLNMLYHINLCRHQQKKRKRSK